VRQHTLALWAMVAGVLPAPVAAQVPCLSARDVAFTPSPPRAGTLFRVHLPASGAALITTARLAGEPLHFRADGDSVSAFAAVPVDSTRGLTLALLCTNGARVDVRVPTRDGEYPLERLTVAPRFSAPPDSALQARQRREAARAAEVSRASHTTPRLFTEPFLVPRTTRITSGFGGGRTFNGTVTSRHMGTDYAGAVGAPVRAANRGVVRLVDGFYLGGNVIYLDHGEGLVTAYLHLSRHRVAEGDTVARGQVIGDVGATGRVTGPHLHFIVRYGNVTVDPESVVDRK
jgi:murein DD-endopeptidase MepM/ murein hydrolase activator NlpD